MSAFRRYAVTAALAGLMGLAACGTTPASQPGPARSPGPATSTQAPPATTPAPATVTPAPSGTPKVPQQPVLRLDSRGSAVLTLQQRLAALHYFDVPTLRLHAGSGKSQCDRAQDGGGGSWQGHDPYLAGGGLIEQSNGQSGVT